MLTVRPPERVEAGPLRRLKQFDWERFLLAKCSAFHLLAAFTLAFAPHDQVYNAGTAPVFALASPHLWALAFAAGGVAAGLGSRYMPHGIPLFLLALAVFPLGVLWFSAFVMAVLQGHGSALSVVVWPFLYSSWLVAIARLGLGKR